MNDLFKQLRDLEKSSAENEKNAKFYKDKYEELRDVLKTKLGVFDNGLTELYSVMSERRGKGKTGRPSKGDNNAYAKVAEDFYRDMVVNDKEIDTDTMLTELGTRGLYAGNSSTYKIREALRIMDGVKTKKDGRSVILYCDKDSEETKQKRIELAKQIGTITEKNEKEKTGDIAVIEMGEIKIDRNKKFKNRI